MFTTFVVFIDMNTHTTNTNNAMSGAETSSNTSVRLVGIDEQWRDNQRSQDTIADCFCV